MTKTTSVDYQTDPSRYEHIKLSFDGAIATLSLAINEDAGLRPGYKLMLINEAADAVNQGVCSINDADAAMKLGVNYPAGPFEWLREYGVSSVVDVLENLDRIYRGDRYRISPWLRLSLTNTTV